MKSIILLLLPLSCLIASDGIKDILYTQAVDEALALSFVGVPVDKIEPRKEAIKGELADPELVDFSIKVLNARNEKSRELARTIIHSESLNLIESHPANLQILPFFQLLESGELLYLQSHPKFFITEQKVSNNDLAQFFHHHSAKPTRSIVFYHYYKEKSMLIGTRFFLADEGGQPKIQLPARKLKSKPVGGDQ